MAEVNLRVIKLTSNVLDDDGASVENINWKFELCYVDDILVFSENFETHLDNLRQVFECLSRANLTLKPSICKFAVKEVKYLGHIICKDGIKVDPEKTWAVSTFPVPK